VVAVALGLMVAIAFGSGDFAGGRASASASTAAVMVISQACGLVGAVALAVLVSAEVAPTDLTYGALAGAANVIGLALLYDALARHAAGVVAPITAVVGGLVPVTWGLARGERPPVVVLVGVALAIVAGAHFAEEPGDEGSRALARGVPQALAAGFALGSSLVFYSETAEKSGQWPVLVARLTALALAVIAAFLLARRSSIAFPRASARTLAILAGAFDIAATGLLVVAIRRDLLSIVAPIVSLAPAFTVILAWWILGERLHRAQRVGLVVALVGLALVAAG
jgi:drug/metabolite transporter (DMT)-like permease